MSPARSRHAKLAFTRRPITYRAEVPSSDLQARCFVRLRAMAKPGVRARNPLSEFQVLDVGYWGYEFRRMVLCSGWERDEWNTIAI